MSDYPLIDISTLAVPLNTTVISSNDQLPILKAYLDSVNEFTIDLETNVVPTFHERKIRLLQIGDKNVQYVVDLLALAGSYEAITEQGNYQAPLWAKPLVGLLTPYLDGNVKTKLGVHLEFEYITLFWCLGIRMWHLYDCSKAHRCIFAGHAIFHNDGMDDMLGVYCKLSVDKTLQTSFNLTDELTPQQIQYAALDVRLPCAIKATQTKLIEKHKLERVVQIENDAIPAFSDMHMRGMFVSRERWTKLIVETLAKHANNILELDKYFKPIVGSKAKPDLDLTEFEEAWRNEKDKEKRAKLRSLFYEKRRLLADWEKNFTTWEGEAAINYASNTQLLNALRKLGFGPKKLPNTSDRNLVKLEDTSPVIKALTNYRETAKILSTYGSSFLEKYVTEQSRVHSRIDPYGAATGRTTSSSPNVQNIPRGSAWRACFVASPGYKVITIDYNGCELRILAELSQEKVWIEAFNKGWDVHSVGAEILFGEEWSKSGTAQCAYYKTGDHQKCDKKLCPVHAKLRDRIKAINFGIAYGMEAGKLADSLQITKEAAQKLLDKYRATFKKVTAYLAESGNFAKMNLHCRTMSGRWRQFAKPTWEEATRRAKEEAEKEEKELHENAVSRKYYSMFGNIEREGKNTPIQGTNADMVKLAMGCGYAADGTPMGWHVLRNYDAYYINMVHDEVVVEAAEGIAEEVLQKIGHCMKVAGAEFVKSVVMEYEGHVDDAWSK